jgi:hypothetical protein
MLPNTAAPRGRTTKAMPYTASVDRIARLGFSFGKKCLAMIVAEAP